jgi:hypothetical protein
MTAPKEPMALDFRKRHGALSTTRWARATLRGILKFEKMSKTKSVERSERPLAKTVLAKLIQITEPTRSIYDERLRELKPNAREALQLLSVWEGKRAELALTQPLSERERINPKTLEAKAAALAREAMDATVRPRKQKS